MEELISIIIPIFNLKGKIERCIESIQKQTVQNYELLLIDDGSDDGSGEVCDIYSQKDSRIKSIHKKNGGVSSARNLGLKLSKGSLITFIDGDDFVSEDYLEKLYIQDEELSIGSTYYAAPDGKIQGINHKEEDGFHPVTQENLAKWFDHSSLYSVWACMFRKSIIEENRIIFDESTTRGEDVIFMLDYIIHCKTVKFCGTFIYYYVRYGKNGSSSSKLNSDNIKALDHLNSYLDLWFKNNDVHSALFYSYSFWVRAGLRGYLYDVVKDDGLTAKEKQEYFKLMYSLPVYQDLDTLFEKTNPIVKTIIKRRSPSLLIISGKIYAITKKLRIMGGRN